MKIRMTGDGRVYSGTPLAIVEKMRARALFVPAADVDTYMREVLARIRVSVDLKGDTVADRCKAFLDDVIFRKQASKLED